MQNRSKRRENEREALRIRIDGHKHIAGVEQCIDMAEQAYQLGDKESVPAIKAKMDGHLHLLNKVLPTPRPVEIVDTGQHGPVLILDMVGAQPFIPPMLEVLDGEIVGIPKATEIAGQSAGDSSADSLFD